MNWILYLHILAACAWIGGSILLFGLGVFIRDKNTQNAVYGAIGPFYGYFETVWLVILIVTGFILAGQYRLFSNDIGEELAYWVHLKTMMVTALSLATLVHLYIAFATHNKSRSPIETVLSRGGSLAIFVLNLAILWAAINLRTML